jgi:hypothetical protein
MESAMAASKGLAQAAIVAKALALDYSRYCFKCGRQALRDRSEIRSALGTLAAKKRQWATKALGASFIPMISRSYSSTNDTPNVSMTAMT